MAKHVVAAVGDIPPGTRRLAQVNGRAIVVFNLGGEFFALNNRCPHRGGSLCQGRQTGLVESDGPGQLPLLPSGRDHPLPLARLGIRHPHRPVLVRSHPRPRASLCRFGAAGNAAGCRALCGGRPCRSASRTTTWWWRREGGMRATKRCRIDLAHLACIILWRHPRACLIGAGMRLSRRCAAWKRCGCPTVA